MVDLVSHVVDRIGYLDLSLEVENQSGLISLVSPYIASFLLFLLQSFMIFYPLLDDPEQSHSDMDQSILKIRIRMVD